MPLPGWPHPTVRWILLSLLTLALGCETVGEPAVRVSPSRRAEDIAATRLAAGQAEVPTPPADVPARPTGPTETQPADMEQQIEWQAPDPIEAIEYLEAELKKIDEALQTPGLPMDRVAELRRNKVAYPKLMERIQEIQRPKVVRLALDDVVRRTLQNNYLIQVQAYNPAIESARVVEAEANFDAVFFTNFNNDKQNRPVASQLAGTDTQNRVFESGVRKLLSTGTQVQASYAATRTETNLVFQTLNPSYFNQFVVEFRQPFLRGFGLDVNRSQIELRKLDRGISVERLRREIRETLYNAEQAYWRLFQARRNVVISGRLLTNLESILYVLEQRAALEYDVFGVQVNLTRSRVEQRKAEFIRRRNDLKNAEDALRAVMNDPAINFSEDIEIIPTTPPAIEPLVLDALGEVTAALNYRSELHEARLAIEQAQIAIGVAKNQALPKLDVVFRYVVDGLGGNWDQAFSQLSKNDFHEYLIQVQLEWPIGNRGPEAVLHQARFKQAQAIAAHRGQIESIIFEVKQAIRDLYTSFDQLGPALRASQATEDQLIATQKRAERRDLPNLQVELDAHESLASSRQGLLQALADYNISLINLERQKGTLLRYNNIVLRGMTGEPYDPTAVSARR